MNALVFEAIAFKLTECLNLGPCLVFHVPPISLNLSALDDNGVISL